MSGLAMCRGGLCRMKLLPVMILAKYHSSAWNVPTRVRDSFPGYCKHSFIATCCVLPHKTMPAVTLPMTRSPLREKCKRQTLKISLSLSPVYTKTTRRKDRQTGLCINLCHLSSLGCVSSYVMPVFFFLPLSYIIISTPFQPCSGHWPTSKRPASDVDDVTSCLLWLATLACCTVRQSPLLHFF